MSLFVSYKVKKNMKKERSPIYNFRFGLICLSSLFFSASYNMLIPELPAYLTSLGGREYIGLIISLFTLTAGLSRPFSGKLTDTIGRKKVMIVGTVVCLVCGFLYPILGTVSSFFLLRLFHGFSTGFTPTALASYVADIVPSRRWGEALGLQGVFFSTGLALGPALGSLIKIYYSFDILFYSSSLMAMVSMIFMANLNETLHKSQPFKLSILKISSNEIIAIEVLNPAFMTFLSYLSFGVILTLIPDWSEHLGIENKGLFFIVFTVSSLLSRFISGKMSDKYGRRPLIILGFIILIVSLFIIGYFQFITGLMIGSAIYGTAMGIITPALNAWTIDLSLPNQRGKAISTMYIALEAGIGFGALFSGWYYQNKISNLPNVFYFCTFMALVGLVFMAFKSRCISNSA